MTLWLAVVGCALAGAAPQPREPEADTLRERYEYGQFSQLEPMAQALLDRGDLTPPQLVEVHLYAGLAAFNLGDEALADRHFTALLRADPDYAPDPFLAPPPALRRFEALRVRLAPELTERREARAGAEARRAQLEAAGRQASVRQLTAPSLWVSFLPFGAGQFQQGRIGVGIAFAASEAILAAASLISFFLYNGLFETVTLSVNNQNLGGTGQIQIRGIPRTRQQTAEVLHALNLGSTVGVYTVYAGGVVEALVRHRESEAPPPTVSIGAQGAGLRLAVQF